MGEGRQDATGQPSTERVSVPQAADHLGTTVDAIRKRVQRGTIPYEKDSDGRVWILLDTGRPRQDSDRDATGHRRGSGASQALVEELRNRLRFVERQLEAERQAHAEARRIIGVVQRIPELEVPQEAPTEPPRQEPPESPTTATEQAGRVEPQPQVEGAQEAAERPWWRRLFGG